MNHVLYTPATIPQERPFRQLLLVFDKIFLYAPSEDLPACDAWDGAVAAYAPVPFGDDLETFRRLIADISANPDDFYGGGLLSMARTASGELDEGAVWQLIAQFAPNAAREDRRIEALYQARLLLKLSEIVEERDREVGEALARVDEQAAHLLQDLKGEDDFEEIRRAAAGLAAGFDSTTAKRRLAAWARLFCHDPRAGEHHLIACDRETFDILADYAGPNLLERPQELAALSLPEPGTPAAATFSRPGNDFFTALQAAAHEAPDRNPLADALPAASETPAAAPLTIHRFANLSLPALMTRLAGESRPHSTAAAPHTLVAVI